MKRSRRMWRQLVVMAIATVVLAIFGAQAVFAQDAAVPSVDELTTMKIGIDTSWVLLTGFLVFFMQLGFAILETGMIRHTAAVNALLENFLEAGIGAVLWWVLGFGLAFGVDNGSGLI